MSTRPSILGALLAFSLLLAGCAGEPPLRELRAYDTAFSEARSAGEEVLAQSAMAIAVKERRERQARGEVEPLYPASFDPETVSIDPESGLPSAIRVRRLAFQTVADYTEALLALAEGRTLAQVQGRVATLGDTVQRLLPLVGLAGGSLPGLAISGLQSAVRVAEQARERRLVERAILEGHDDVDGILAALIADTPDLYALQRARWELELDAADKEMGDARRSMINLAQAHRAATDPGDVRTLVQIEQRVDGAFAATVPPAEADRLPRLILAPAAEGGAPFGAELVSELQAQADRMEAAAARYAEGVEAINLAHATMKEYVLLLRRTRQSLDALRAAVTAPSQAGDVLVRVVENGVALRQQADQVRETLRALRAR